MIPFKKTAMTLVDIEHSFDVNSVTYAGVKVWPLVRYLLYQKLSHPDKESPVASDSSNAIIPNLRLNTEQLQEIKTKAGAEILFVATQYGEYVENEAGKFVNPFIDSLIDVVKNKYRYLKIEAGSNNHREALPRLEPTLFVRPQVCKPQPDPTIVIDEFESLRQVVSDIAGVSIAEESVLAQIRIIKAWRNFFLELLSVVQPKAAFTVCYYQQLLFGLLWACRKLRVHSVDIQHGACGEYHGLYTHWTRIPPDGYDFLPDTFWSWGSVSKKCFEKNLPSGCLHHRSIAGGNVRVARWMQQQKLVVPGINNFFEKLTKFNKVILVSVGHMDVPEPPLPDILVEAMQQSPSDWFWLLRLHPFFKGDQEKAQLTRIIENFGGIDNYEIENATTCHLFELLQGIHHNITTWPSTYYEALAFGVPTTIVNANSIDVFREDFDKGLLTYANTADALRTHIQNGGTPMNNANPVEFIDIRRSSAEAAVDKILTHNRASAIEQPRNSQTSAFDSMSAAGEMETDVSLLDKCAKNQNQTLARQMPSTYTVETILGCDLKCPECAVGGDLVSRKKGWMSFEKFKIIADKIRPYCQYLYLHIWGEPLLNKDIFKMIEYASAFSSTNISTNGLSMTEEKAEKLIKSGVTDIIVSIDGVSQEVYEKYRIGGQVDKAVSALKTLQKYKIQLSSDVNINPQFIVFEHNQHEMQPFNELCRSIGLKPIFKAPYIRNQDSRFRLSDYSQFSRPVYQNLPDLKAAMKDCPNAKNVFTVLLDGSVVLCCHDHGKATCYGNIFKQSVEDIWHGDKLKNEHCNILSGNAPEFCVDNCMTWFLAKDLPVMSSQQKNCKEEKPAVKIQEEPAAANLDALDSVDHKAKAVLPNGRKINLCSGSNNISGYVNIDFLPGADVVIDLEKELLPFSENSVSVLVCNSAINYFTRSRAQEIINDVYRILKPGGIARFGTQDLRVLAGKYINNDRDFYFQKLPDGRERFPGATIGDKLNEFFYGFGVRDKHCKYLYDYESLKVLFQNAGYQSIEQKKFRESLIPEIDRIDNRPNQMFFLEAVKGPTDADLTDHKETTGSETTKMISPEPGCASLDDRFKAIRTTAFNKWESGDHEKAWQLFLQALNLKSDDKQTVMKSIEILGSLGRFKDILTVCQKYLAAQPDDRQMQKILHNVKTKMSMDLPDPKKVSQARAEIAKLSLHKNDLHSDETHLDACLQWLTKAQQANSGGGVSSIYRLETKKWDVDYPETTGYIIPTFLSYYKYSGEERYLRSAIEMGDWEVDIQAPDGGAGEPLGVYGLLPRVFNTGQVLFGWMALYKETGDSKYLEAALKAANWIVESQDQDGKWSRNTYMGPKAYHSRVAWSLLELYSISSKKSFLISARKATNWIMSLGHQNGWFEKNSLATPGKPWTHLIGYVLVGLLESCMLDSHNTNITKLISLLANAAKNLADYCIKSAETGVNGQLKTLPGTFDQYWMSNDNWTCVTGNVQIAFFLRKMFALFNDDRLMKASDLLIDDLKSIHFLDSISDSNLYGGLPGSYPIGGGYASNAIPNWGVKFFADTLLLRVASFSDQKYLG